MTAIALVIFAAIILSGFLSVYLDLRQAAAVRAHRSRVPRAFDATVTLEEHQRAADYTLARTKLTVIETIYDADLAIVWLAFLLRPVFNFVAAHIPAGLTRSVATIVLVTAISYLLTLPFSIYKTFRLEAQFGFNRTTPAMFALDQVKAAALQLVLGVPLLYGLFALLHALPNLWWIFAWAALMIIMVAMIVIYPAFIAPLFNKFTPMADGPMKAGIETLLAKCGFESNGLFVMDASKRSAHGNAYFSGFGRAKRIVFFDTLLEKHTNDEILSVLAHELGHYKFGHVVQKIGESAVLALIVFAVLHWAFAAGTLPAAFHLPNDPSLVLMIVMTAIGPFSSLLAPLTNFLSRRAEFQADAFAKSMVGSAPMISALTKLTRDNLATLTPDRLYTLFNYSHPPVPERIAHLQG
ncbi:MAG: M48 family metallopeptidase [Methylovirgula sp.]|uniref:M48 family metallopeptidase n=1 Tax=Methylovirgula sp. TaxID=1978224 RepID=UPI0030760372